MNVEIGAEAAPFPEKEYINGIAVAVYPLSYSFLSAKRREHRFLLIVFLRYKHKGMD
jgi:hypothetical protein